MRSTTQHVVVLVTAPSMKTARELTRTVLEGRVAACVNLVPRVESHFWWGGKLDLANETLMVIKTTRSRCASLERVILNKHPYETPEFVVLPLNAGSNTYLDWIGDNVVKRPKDP